MVDSGLRARIERLLQGDLRTEDLTRLFLYARDRCDGREAVREIGDFIAHKDDRTKGILTRELRDWFLIMRFHLSACRTIEQNKGRPSRNVPANFPEFLAASMRRTGAEVKKYGFSLSDVHRMLPVLCSKFIKQHDGTLSISPRHSQKEVALMNALGGYISVRPVFTADRLFIDFCETLRSNGLLSKTEFKNFSVLKPVISLFAVSVMHNSVIHIEPGLTCKLAATCNTAPLGICINAPVPSVENPAVVVTSSVFSTYLMPEQSCEDELRSQKEPWTFELEITASRKLARLG